MLQDVLLRQKLLRHAGFELKLNTLLFVKDVTLYTIGTV